MESFGARLKREREQRKVTLDDISVSTKIGTRFLVALEADRFDQLPGGIFNKGFVRAYARCLGIDENQAVADFVAASEPSLPDTQPQDAPVLEALAVRVPESVKKRRSDDGIPWGVFAVALLVLAFGFAVWGFHAREKSPRPMVPAPPQVPVETPAVAPQKATPEPAQPSPEATSPASPSPPPQPLAGTPETAAPVAAPATSAGAFVVLVRAREDSWVSITADGKQIIQDTLTAQAEKSIQANHQIVIKTGNVGALDISFNGKKLAPQGQYDQVKTLTFDADGLRP